MSNVRSNGNNAQWTRDDDVDGMIEGSMKVIAHCQWPFFRGEFDDLNMIKWYSCFVIEEEKEKKSGKNKLGNDISSLLDEGLVGIKDYLDLFWCDWKLWILYTVRVATKT